MGRWSQLSPLGASPGLGVTPTPLDSVRRLCGDDQLGTGRAGGAFPGSYLVGDRGLAYGVMWGQTCNPRSLSAPDPI